MIVASVTFTRYGLPDINRSRYVVEAAKRVHEKLLTGSETRLVVESQKRKEVYPQEVLDMATECWVSDATTPEPSKHQWPQSAPQDLGGETIPERLQVITNDEAYEKFQEKYSEKVKHAMTLKCDKVRGKHRNDTPYNKKVIERLDNMQDRFPSKH